MKNKKGFTLIELLVVIAVLGILVLLAMPKYLDYAEKSRIALITHDVKISENALATYLLEENNKLEDFNSAEIPVNSKVYDKRGVYTGNAGGNLHDVTGNIKSHLEGSFLANQDGKVYYVDDSVDSNEDEWVSKYRPFVTEVLTTELEQSSVSNPVMSSSEYGDAACDEWHNITDDTQSWHYQNHCSNHYAKVYDAGVDKYYARVEAGEFSLETEMRPVAVCVYEIALGQKAPNEMTSNDLQTAFFAHLLELVGEDGLEAEMSDPKYIPCIELQSELEGGDIAAKVIKAQLKALIDEVTKQMDINNDYLPEYILT